MSDNESEIQCHLELDDMEFQPLLFVRKVDLPPNTTPFSIIAQLENSFQHKGQYHCIEAPSFMCITFPNKSVAVMARKDGIDFGQRHVDLYDVANHILWLAHNNGG